MCKFKLYLNMVKDAFWSFTITDQIKQTFGPFNLQEDNL